MLHGVRGQAILIGVAVRVHEGQSVRGNIACLEGVEHDVCAQCCERIPSGCHLTVFARATCEETGMTKSKTGCRPPKRSKQPEAVLTAQKRSRNPLCGTCRALHQEYVGNACRKRALAITNYSGHCQSFPLSDCTRYLRIGASKCVSKEAPTGFAAGVSTCVSGGEVAGSCG